MTYKFKKYIENNKETIKNAIEESIENNDEITLPGMGVFMEILWNHANEELKDNILKILEENIKKQVEDEQQKKYL